MSVNSYFSHDSNARNSYKLLSVRMKYGAEGYGIYFMMIERLREESEYMSVKDYNMIAFDLRVDASKVKSIIEDFGLFAFTDDGECFYSEGLKERMEIKDDKSKKLSEAGKKGASNRWNKNTIQPVSIDKTESDSQAIATPIAFDGKESKVKERKVKESKVKEKDLRTLYAFLPSLLVQKVDEWIAYKQEQHKFTYKPIGLQSLVSEMERHLLDFSPEAIAALIDTCMANGYKGIVWDKMEKQRPKTQERKSFMDIDF